MNINLTNLEQAKLWQNEVYNNYLKSNSIISKFDLNYWFKKVSFKEDCLLKGLAFSIKNNFAIEMEKVTLGTKMLKNFKHTYNAKVFDLLLKNGAIPLFSANLDELAMGGTGLSSNFGIINNPIDDERMIGGSSSGSAYQVAKKLVHFSIGSDTGDSVRKPAAYSGIIGFKPTWEIVSREGLSDFAPSFDTVSWFASSIQMCATIFDVLKNIDSKFEYPNEKWKKIQYSKNLESTKKFTLVVFENILDGIKDKSIVKNWEELINKLAKHFEIKKIKFDQKLILANLMLYRNITSLEAFSCNSNLTSFLFGENNNKNTTFIKNSINARSESFLYEVKRRFLWANYVILNKDIYEKSLKMRTKIINSLDDAFNQGDAIIMPATLSKPSRIDDFLHHINDESYLDDYLGLFNSKGSPSITIPIKANDFFSLNINTNIFKDLECLQIACKIEKLL